MLVTKLTKKILVIAVLIAIAPVAGAYAQTSENATDNAMTGDNSTAMSPPITGPIAIGALFPLTGQISSVGVEMKVASELAVEDFNAYLAESGAEWWLEIAIEDTATAPATALEKIQGLHARGITNVVGPLTSGNVQHVKGYADQSGMLIISCCSTAPGLSIAGDSIYRTVPDDKNQGNAIAKLLERDSIAAIVPIIRGDTYGDGLLEATKTSFESKGGVVHEGIRYNTDTPELGLEVSSLADDVQDMVDEHGAENVAVLIISFDEAVQIVQSAASYDILKDVRWYGTESTADAKNLITDRIASEFINEVDFTAMQFLPSLGPQADHVLESITEELGAPPIPFVYPAYDAVWLLGKSIMEAGSTDSEQVKNALPGVAAENVGAMNTNELNDAGDLALANYQVRTIVNSTWTEVGKYSAEYDVLVTGDQPTDEVTVGSLYPLTGRSSSTGYATREATDLGAADFNTFLQSLGEEWRLQVVAEDSTSLPTIALEKVQTLLTRGIDIIIGPRPSAEVTQVKQYADTNNMMIISCCSTAPTLAIADDSVFRIAVDDVYQGAGVSKMLEAEGIEAVVPIWLGDAYGDGLVNEVIDRAESRGYVVSDGVRYEPLLPDFAVSVAALADQVQEQVDAYGADKVAVFMTSFDESVPILQAASQV